MIRLVRLTVFASALALASVGASHFATAQEKTMRPQCLDCVRGGGGGGADNGIGEDQGSSGRRAKQFDSQNDQDGPNQDTPSRRKWKSPPDDQAEFGDNEPGQGTPTRRKWKTQPSDQYQQGGDDDAVIDKKRVRRADRKWKFDSDRHERRRHEDKRYRFYFDGFWYPSPYWDEPYYDIGPYRVSCREGAEIVSERFNRVRIVECDGRVFTYLGRRYGDTFEIKLSSRTGRILDAREI